MRHRRIVPALTAVGVLALSGCTPTAAVPVGTGASIAGIAPDVVVGGRSLPFHGLQGWTEASIPSRSAAELTVFAVGGLDAAHDRQTGGPCGPPILRLSTVETARAVTVFVGEYEQPAAPNQPCSAVGYLPGPQRVRLTAPLGTRTVENGSTGKAVRLLDGTQYPDLPSAPAAWGPSLLEGVFPSYPVGIVTRRWILDDRADRMVLLESETPQQVRTDGPYGAVVQHIEVHGVPATVYRVPDTGYLVQWAPNPNQVVSLRLDDVRAHSMWSQADAERFAAAVTGYRIGGHDRLAQPSSPGTVAAAFNSADGPVSGASELFKSSGVYVSLDCMGSGTVEVVLRGQTYSSSCGATLSHHVHESHGSAMEPFTVSVHASPTVRWALTLARASLDGS